MSVPIRVGRLPKRFGSLTKLLRGNSDPVAVQKIIRAFMFLMGKSNIRTP